MLFESALAYVVCRTSVETVDDIVSKVGLRARATDESESFAILSGGRSVLDDPPVEQQLLGMAVVELKSALAIGIIPEFSFRTASELR